MSRDQYEVVVRVTIDDVNLTEVKQWAERLIRAAMNGEGSRMSIRLPRNGEGGEVVAVRRLT